MVFLIVDDQKELRESLHEVIMFLRPNATVLFAKNGAECLSIMQQQLPTMILLDINMPVMDGYEVATTLRAHPERPSFTIVCMTGQSADGDMLEKMKAICDDFLKKPFSLDELAAIVEKYG